VNIADTLLEWASEKGGGSWDEFRAAWQWLISKDDGRRPNDPADATSVIAGNLSALAHLEISWGGDAAWQAAPPVITMLPNSGGRALLTGARTRALYNAQDSDAPEGTLVSAADELDLWVDAVEQRQGPSSLVIASNKPEDAARLAELCGVEYSYSVSEQLSMVLPPLRLMIGLGEEGSVPQGFPVEGFDPVDIRWTESSEAQAQTPGLYRVRTWQAHIHVLTTPTGVSLRVPRQPAVFEVLRWERRGVLEYDPSTWELWAPVNARLPLLHERAAVLCSGLLPRFEVRDRIGGIKHFNVPPRIASRIASSLAQEIETGD
jgi:hypothetical protein